MDLEERTVVLMENKSSTRWIWKVCGACLFAVLCVGGIRLGVWYWNREPEMMMQLGQTEAPIKNGTAEKTGPPDAASAPVSAAPSLHPSSLYEATRLPAEEDSIYRISSKQKAAIHLQGDYSDSEDVNDQLEWRNNYGMSFSQGGLQLVDNGIVIPQTGLYFVYSQVSFRITNDVDEMGKHLTPLSHSISRYSFTFHGTMIIMRAVKSPCQTTAEGDSFYDSLYLGSVFHLRKGDRLGTKTNHLSDVDLREDGTFFGVFAL